MDQLPLFLNLRGKNVVLVGEGDAADAKQRLIERAGGICVTDCPNDTCRCAKIAFVAVDDDEAAIEAAERLRAKGMLVNVVDRPGHCDFTTPAIVDRAPILVAVGTGGASAGMAKAIRQRIEALLPGNVGKLASAVFAARDTIKARWPDAAGRRRAFDNAFAAGGTLDPFSEQTDEAVSRWLSEDEAEPPRGLIKIQLFSNDPEELTLRSARLLGEADHVYYEAGIAAAILDRARADAVRHSGSLPENLPEGLSLYLRNSSNQ